MEESKVLPLSKQDVHRGTQTDGYGLYSAYKRIVFFFKRTVLGKQLARGLATIALFLTLVYFFIDGDERHVIASKISWLGLEWPPSSSSARKSPGKLSDIYQIASIISSPDYDYTRAYKVFSDAETNKGTSFDWSDWVDMHSVESLIGIGPNDENWPFSDYCRIDKENPFQSSIHNCTQLEVALNGRLYLSKHSWPSINVVSLGKKSKQVTIGLPPNKNNDDTNHDNNVDSTDHIQPYSFAPSSTVISDRVQVALDEKLFEFNVDKLTQITDDMPQEAMLYAENVKTWLEQVPMSHKYFDECYFDKDRYSVGSHYDWRFFDGIRLGEEHDAILYHMLRTWAKFAQQENILSWISHGSLLGWYWNGLAMPYDSDNDIQMPVMELVRFARLYNQSIVLEDHTEGTGRYFIDVSPWHVERVRGNGMNVIDARFIDMRSGLYIDITGLTHTKKEHQPGSDNKGHRRFEVNCKNHHYYAIEDLSPLRQTTYQGIHVYIPNNFPRVLKSEYEDYNDHKFRDWIFDGSLNMWIPREKCKDYTDLSKKFDQTGHLTLYGACGDEDLYEEYSKTNGLVEDHFEEMNIYYGTDNWHPPSEENGKTEYQLNTDWLEGTDKETIVKLLSKNSAVLRHDPI